MNLNQIEKDNLRSFRAWSSWLAENTPAEFLNSLDTQVSNTLIHLLEHFNKNSGATMNLYASGALIITTNRDDIIIDQFKSIIQHKINKIFITSIDSQTPDGKQNLIISHVIFYENDIKETLTGFNDNKKEEEIYRSLLKHKGYEDVTLSDYQKIITHFDRYFLESANAKFILSNIILYLRCSKDINVKAEVLKNHPYKNLTCIALAHKHSAITGFIVNLLNVLKFHKIKMVHAKSIYIAKSFNDENVLIHFYIQPTENVEVIGKNYSRVLEALAMVQWFEFENTFNIDYINLDFSIHHSLFLRSLEEFIFQMLNNVDEHLYNATQIHDAFIQHPTVAKSIMSYFTHRFNPILCNKNGQSTNRNKAITLINSLDTGIVKINDCRKNILNMGVLFIDHILKTNYYVIRRSALSYRIDPDILKYIPNPNIKDIFPEIPYGIFFIKGKNFIAFNVRFRDLSRGGVRTLVSLDAQKLKHEIKGVFKECYNLAYTQQKKNKDIPEGGSKSVIFIKPYVGMKRDLELEKSTLTQDFILTKGRSKQNLSQLIEDKRNVSVKKQLFDAQQSFCDTLLDLLVWNPKTNRLTNSIIKDYHGKEELIFLGPDENMTDQMIDWISTRSSIKKYRVGTSFISGKKLAGINHKYYGVTSLGVHQYLLKALKFKNIGGNKSFRVKMSGGPDGDVAGNELLNLINTFGKKVQIQCIQDGSGILYDPKGISHTELKRLFKETKGISHIKSSHLHEGGFVIHIRQTRELKKGIVEIFSRQYIKDSNEKNELTDIWINASEANHYYHHFLHQLETEVFLPCGGRPLSLNDNNWNDFMNEDTPSSQIIVEGANLYLSNFARNKLEENGVLIIKDSSANKCGVICSSFEILAGLIMDENTFLSIKERFVKDILVILKKNALQEADLILSSINNHRKYIESSDSISSKINEYTDLIFSELQNGNYSNVFYNKLKKNVIEYHFPKILKTKFKTEIQKLPKIYLDAIIASQVASSLIYKNGIDYQPNLFDTLSVELEEGLLK